MQWKIKVLLYDNSLIHLDTPVEEVGGTLHLHICNLITIGLCAIGDSIEEG